MSICDLSKKMRKNLLYNLFYKATNVLDIRKTSRYIRTTYPNEIKIAHTNNIFRLMSVKDLLISKKHKTVYQFSTEKKPLNTYTREQIEEKVIHVLKKYLPNNAEIKYNEELEKNKTKDNRNWDFLDTVEFLIDVESEFNITIPDDTADNIKTVQELIDYLMKLNSEGSKPIN